MATPAAAGGAYAIVAYALPELIGFSGARVHCAARACRVCPLPFRFQQDARASPLARHVGIRESVAQDVRPARRDAGSRAILVSIENSISA